MQRARPAPDPHSQKPGLPARAILIADSAWDALLGTGLIVAAVTPVTRPLGAGALRPWPLPVALGAVCLASAAFLLHASAGTPAARVCHAVSPANMTATLAGVALLLAYPHAAHPYVVALAVASTGCAVFASLEWTVR